MSRTVNGIGWEIQEYTLLTGWVSCATILLCNKFATKEDALEALDRLLKDDTELRVYELLRVSV